LYSNEETLPSSVTKPVSKLLSCIIIALGSENQHQVPSSLNAMVCGSVLQADKMKRLTNTSAKKFLTNVIIVQVYDFDP
jgi:hypothetical protein